jgi:hypothetical protein
VEAAIVATANAASPIFLKLNMDVLLKDSHPVSPTSSGGSVFLDLGANLFERAFSEGE